MRQIRIQLPATVTNPGAGFDRPALSVGLHNELNAETADSAPKIEI